MFVNIKTSTNNRIVKHLIHVLQNIKHYNHFAVEYAHHLPPSQQPKTQPSTGVPTG